MKPVYLNNWVKVGKSGIAADFEIARSELKGAKILVASYTYEDYSGSAYVLFEKNGKLFENHGSHCSCNGLEGQWEPEETTRAAITHRLEKGTWGEEDRIKDHVKKALKKV